MKQNQGIASASMQTSSPTCLSSLPLLMAPDNPSHGTGSHGVIVDRADDTGFIRAWKPTELQFSLDARQAQQLAYWLTHRSAIATDPIVSRPVLTRFWGTAEAADLLRRHCRPYSTLREVRRRSGLLPSCSGPTGGNHNETTSTQKFLPSFSFEDLSAAAHRGAADRRCKFAALPMAICPH